MKFSNDRRPSAVPWRCGSCPRWHRKHAVCATNDSNGFKIFQNARRVFGRGEMLEEWLRFARFETVLKLREKKTAAQRLFEIIFVLVLSCIYLFKLTLAKQSNTHTASIWGFASSGFAHYLGCVNVWIIYACSREQIARIIHPKWQFWQSLLRYDCTRCLSRS